MRSADLIGDWKIKHWVQTYDDGRVTHPIGKDLKGVIHYGQHHMFCLIAKARRPQFETGGQWNASNDEKAAAYDSFMSYAGTYYLAGDEVVHEVDASLYPGWEGGKQRRRARLAEGELHIVARLEDGTPEARTATLVWERLDDNPVSA